MCGRGAITCAFADCVENLLEIGRPRNNDSNVDGAKIEKKPEVIEVSIKKWILVVPLQFERDPAFEAVDLMGR